MPFNLVEQEVLLQLVVVIPFSDSLLDLPVTPDKVGPIVRSQFCWHTSASAEPDKGINECIAIQTVEHLQVHCSYGQAGKQAPVPLLAEFMMLE